MSITDTLKVHEKDTGSTGVQISRLLTRIEYLSSVLAKKDHHSRRGLLLMVSQMRKLTKYMRRTDPAGYEKVRAAHGLRK